MTDHHLQTQAVFAAQDIPMGTTLTAGMRRIELAEMVTVITGNKNLKSFANRLTLLKFSL